jgi:hypothetical protein
MTETNDNYTPCYPDGVLPKDEKTDPPAYNGDVNDLTERRNTKLFNLWTLWSDMRTNQTLLASIEKNTKDDDEKRYLKGLVVVFLDRMGKMLADTNLLEELKREGDDETPVPQ